MGWAILFLCFDAVFWALLVLRPVGNAQMVALDDVLQCIGPLLAVPLCLVRLPRQWLGASLFLAHSLGIQVVAEGVEDQATWDLLASLTCDIAQGYYLSRPLPPTDLMRWLNAREEGTARELEDRTEAVAL